MEKYRTSKVKVQTRVSPQVKMGLAQLAKKEGVAEYTLVAGILERYLLENKKC